MCSNHWLSFFYLLFEVFGGFFVNQEKAVLNVVSEPLPPLLAKPTVCSLILCRF